MQPAPILEGRQMKVSYDETTDTLSVILKDNTPIAESDEDKPGLFWTTMPQVTWCRWKVLMPRNG